MNLHYIDGNPVYEGDQVRIARDEPLFPRLSKTLLSPINDYRRRISMYDQLQAIEDRYEELGELLSDPEVISDTKRFMQLSKEEANTRETVEVYRRYKEVVQGITDTEELLGEKLDDEMAELAKEELSELKKEKEVLEEKIKDLAFTKRSK